MVALSSRRDRDLAELLVVGLLIIDPSGEIQFLNKAVEGIVGYRREELLGWSIDRLLPGGTRDMNK